MSNGATISELTTVQDNSIIAPNVNYLPTALCESKAVALGNEILKDEQVECPVTHRFAPGIYIREIFIPAGTYAIGHWHKNEHLNIMLSGRMNFYGENGEWVELIAPATFVAPAGRKIAYIHEAVVWQNIYATEETDTEKLEDMILVKEMSTEEEESVSLITASHDTDGDIEDYYKAIAEYGFNHKEVREISLNEDDQIPFPYGGYSVTVAKSRIDGKGLFATASFIKGDTIAPARLGDKRTPAGRYVNHSKTPNCVFMLDEKGDGYLVANSEIKGYYGGSLGDELTVDYRETLNLQGYRS